MITEADEHRDEAVSLIRKAVRELSKIVVDECSGSEEYRSDYLTCLREAQHKLIEARDLLR